MSYAPRYSPPTPTITEAQRQELIAKVNGVLADIDNEIAKAAKSPDMVAYLRTKQGRYIAQLAHLQALETKP